jgi:hypothetical protein
MGRRTMNSWNQFGKVIGGMMHLWRGHPMVLMAVLLTTVLSMARSAPAQVVNAGDQGGVTLTAGATASGYQVQYGEQKLLGVAGVVDLDTRRRFGLEAEGRWLMFHETNQLHATTYLAGPRYHFSHGKFQYYAKGLVGLGQFNFPYNYAQGNYLVIAPGGGVDYRWKHRISLRLADVEYQIWPQFTYNGSSYETMSSYGVSVGVLYHIF